MKVYFGQIYIEPGINYPFSHAFQVWLSGAISNLVETSEEYRNKYGQDYVLMFRISAKEGMSTIEIKGPTVSRKNKDVEFTIFLPHKGGVPDEKTYQEAFALLLDGVVTVMKQLGINVSKILENISPLCDKMRRDPAMITQR